MPLEQLCYTPKDETMTGDEHPNTYVLMVDSEMYEKQKKDKSIPNAQVVDSFDLLKYEVPGKSGRLVRPSKREIEDVFKTANEDAVVAFMLANGEPHGKKGAM